MTSYSNRPSRWHGHTSAALGLTTVLLLTPCAALGSVVVDESRLAQAEAEEQKRELEEAREINVAARRNAQQLQRQIDGLEAEVIDLGLLLTLDDALFAGNSERLNAAGSERLDKLVEFLEDYPYRDAQIESSAVCRASAGYDATLSQRRAVAVASYIIQRGIAAARVSARVSAAREQQTATFGGDCDAQGLHRNRQVMVLIEDVLTSARQP
jgi:outer membrane protein OmpA-like peptidoglycan-associated protein